MDDEIANSMREEPLHTKNCIDPWKTLFFSPDGTIYPCCGSPLPTGDFGNINSIDFELSGTDTTRIVFSCEAFRKLRTQLLEGALQEACESCRVVSEYVPLDVLRKRVVSHLRYGGRLLTDTMDLSSEFAFTDCLTNVTDKCNFSCIYCFVHSNDSAGEGMRNYQEINRERFLKIVSYLTANGLEYLNFSGVGELTAYPRWQELCLDLIKACPDVRLTLVTNFGRKYSDADLDILSRFFQIRISCDTLNPEQYAWLRPGGRLPLLLENIDRLIAGFKHRSSSPKLFFIITESDAMLDGVTDLARFAVDRNISLYFSNLSLVDGSLAAKSGCLKKIADIPGARILGAWEIVHDIPRRIRAARPQLDFICDLGPLYNAVRIRAESITLNRFVPSENELVYQSFASAQSDNPDMYLRKFFLSFDDCVKGIFIRSGARVALTLPYPAGLLRYRIIWCRDISGKSFSIYTGRPLTTVVGARLSFSAKMCPRRFTHVLLEVLSYEPCPADKLAVSLLDSSLLFPFYPLTAVAEYSDRRYQSAMAVSEFLKAYPVIHKFAERVYRFGMRIFSRIRKG
jgi:MoaA/NifB/PqqE/SkfB family radical SAM enzyme